MKSYHFGSVFSASLEKSELNPWFTRSGVAHLTLTLLLVVVYRKPRHRIFHRSHLFSSISVSSPSRPPSEKHVRRTLAADCAGRRRRAAATQLSLQTRSPVSVVAAVLQRGHCHHQQHHHHHAGAASRRPRPPSGTSFVSRFLDDTRDFTHTHTVLPSTSGCN